MSRSLRTLVSQKATNKTTLFNGRISTFISEPINSPTQSVGIGKIANLQPTINVINTDITDLSNNIATLRLQTDNNTSNIDTILAGGINIGSNQSASIVTLSASIATINTKNDAQDASMNSFSTSIATINTKN